MDNRSCENASDFIKSSCHYFPLILPDLFKQMPGRGVWAISFSWMWTENELWTPHALLLRTQAILGTDTFAVSQQEKKKKKNNFRWESNVMIIDPTMKHVELFSEKEH